MANSRITFAIRRMCLMLICCTILESVCGDKRLCGPGLRETMDLVCPNGFHGYKTKRNSLAQDEDTSSKSDELESLQVNYGILPFLSGQEATGMAKIRRRRHGIVHECCDKPCSIDELRTYCVRQN